MFIVAIALGGMVGAVLRYLMSGWIQKISHSAAFPFGTVSVNLLGCLLIGLLGGFFETREALPPALRAFLMIGLLGSFTTFSTFEYETLHLLRDSEFIYAALNLTIQLIAGLVLVFIGYFISTHTRL